jgi:hypothetical protein
MEGFSGEVPVTLRFVCGMFGGTSQPYSIRELLTVLWEPRSLTFKLVQGSVAVDLQAAAPSSGASWASP